jgi:hypothetical protein
MFGFFIDYFILLTTLSTNVQLLIKERLTKQQC